MATKGPRINILVISKAKYTILVYLFIIILIKPIILPNNYNLIFKPK